MDNNTNQLNPMLCKSNCGFFGNASCDGYCSKCYKDHVKRQNSGSAAGRVTPTSSSSSSSSSASHNTATITSNNEIPVNSSNNSHQLESIGEMTASGVALNTSSALTSDTTTTSNLSKNSSASFAMPLLQPLQTQTSIPIPIPSKQPSQSHNAEEQIGMSVPVDLIGSSLCASSVDESMGTSIGNGSIGSEKKKRTKCSLDCCKRKVGLTGFDCRCGGLYCWEHRYSDKHNCNFDYKELGQDQIRKSNPIVVGEKINKI